MPLFYALGRALERSHRSTLQLVQRASSEGVPKAQRASLSFSFLVVLVETKTSEPLPVSSHLA